MGVCPQWQQSILAPTNTQVNSYNAAILNQLPGAFVLFCATNSLEEHANILEDSESKVVSSPDAILDYVTKVQPNEIPNHLLQIKLVLNFVMNRQIPYFLFQHSIFPFTVLLCMSRFG